MTDQEAIEWMKASPCPEADGCELCAACAHAVSAIETLVKVRELLRAWNASEDTCTADELETKIAAVVR